MKFPDSASSALFPPFDTCPACRATGLQPVAAGDQVIFSCSRCQCLLAYRPKLGPSGGRMAVGEDEPFQRCTGAFQPGDRPFAHGYLT
jgi:hypothetical protein